MQVDSPAPGTCQEILRDTFAAFRSLQRAVVVDRDVDIFDPVDVEWAITTRFNPDTGMLILPGEEGHILNPMVTMAEDGRSGTVTKIGMDATVPADDKARFERVLYQQVELRDYDITRDALQAMFTAANSEFEGILRVTSGGLTIPVSARPLTRMIARAFDAYDLSKAGHSSAI